jgi:hypothetical protein
MFLRNNNRTEYVRNFGGDGSGIQIKLDQVELALRGILVSEISFGKFTEVGVE